MYKCIWRLNFIFDWIAFLSQQICIFFEVYFWRPFQILLILVFKATFLKKVLIFHDPFLFNCNSELLLVFRTLLYLMHTINFKRRPVNVEINKLKGLYDVVPLWTFYDLIFLIWIVKNKWWRVWAGTFRDSTKIFCC